MKTELKRGLKKGDGDRKNCFQGMDINNRDDFQTRGEARLLG